MATKLPSTYSEADRNWQWPEKTWFQERLNSIKAREQEERRKASPSPSKGSLSEPIDPNDDDTLKLD